MSYNIEIVDHCDVTSSYLWRNAGGLFIQRLASELEC